MLLASTVRGRGGGYAFSLVELIGVLAALAVLSAALIPAAIRQLDRVAAEQEAATLKSFSDALQQYIVAARTIPDQTTWYSAVASKLGISTNDVLYNVHQQSHQVGRMFLIDGALQMGWGTNGLPYSQPRYFTNVNTAPALPASARLMIVSSLGKALPAAISNGVFNASWFSDLWNSVDGTVPTNTPWVGWNGNPYDVKLQRINLAPLFVHLLLAQYGTTNLTAYYYVDAVGGVTVPTQVVALDGYFIQGSVVSLYNDQYPTNLETMLILSRDTSLVFEQGTWRDSITGGKLSGVTGVADVVQQFLSATPNTNALYYSTNASLQNTQQVRVLNSMLSYMSNYNAWAAGGFTDTTLKNSLKNTIQPALMNDIQGLYGKTGNTSYYPTNPSPCF